MTFNKKIGIISIKKKIDPILMNFDDAYRSIGLNTGNMMFTTAIFNQIDGDLSHIGFQFDAKKINATYDALVIPAANWLGSHSNWDWFSDILEKVEIPVVTIGIGAQADSAHSPMISWNDSSIRLAKLLASKAPYLSTRGHFTSASLQQIGVMNVVTTGCPSLYQEFPRAQKPGTGDLLLQSTRYGISKAFAETPSLNQVIFQMAFENQLDMIYQSEPEEMKYLLKKAPDDFFDKSAWMNTLCTLYGADSPESLKSYLDLHGRVYFNLEDWSAFLKTRSGVLGTRLHGAILALNSGVPAVLIPHDSRTGELSQFAKIPTANLRAFPWTEREMAKIPEIMDQVSLYEETKAFNFLIYKRFLEANDLSLRPEGMSPSMLK